MTLAVLSAMALTDKHDPIIRQKLPIATVWVYTTTTFCSIRHNGTTRKPHSEITSDVLQSKKYFKNRYFSSNCGTWVNIKHKMPLKNIRTFHSLAHRIVQPTQEINEDYENEMAEHLKILLQDDPRLKPYLYEFFKKEMEDIDYEGLLLNETDYYAHAKYCWQSISLGGDRVKSYGEKCIADFLFEHGLAYKYERPYLRRHPDGNLTIYKPDFAIYDSIAKNTFILEHWAIPEKDYYSDTKIWRSGDKTKRQYADEREKKRQYWNSNYWQTRRHYLLETDISWLVNGRDEYETRLKSLLESKGITCNRLPEEELLDKVYRNCSNKLFTLFVSFIQKCRRNGYTPESIKEKRNNYKTPNQKEEVFLRVAPEIFEKYENSLDESDKLDFDRLIKLAVENIHSTRGDCYICDNKNNVNIKVKDVKYVLIDEFQDFSTPFYDIITAIKKYNSNVKMFCVGDDWQAINGFAGSDLKYFYEFENHYSDTSKRHILTNYRSGSKIVDAGNQLMNGLGEKSTCSPSSTKSCTVDVVNIEDYHIEGRNNQDDTEQYTADRKYDQACEIVIPTRDGGEPWRFKDYDTARYLKAIHCILKENIKLLSQENKNCFVLTRTNRFGCFPNTARFKDKILEVFSEVEQKSIGRNRLEEKIHVMTAHKSKGKEADIVFILKCNMRTFPMIHPDNRLFGIFGETEENVLAEEKRLFYVALTRAKQKVFLLTEAEDKSPFLGEIGVI